MMVQELAAASGSRWLIAGQVMDIEGEGATVSKSALRFIHQAKTAALLTCALRLGAMSANATPSKLQSITEFGQALGLAFQVIDDILDVTQTTEKLGKTAGKDVAATKATYPALFGLERARAVAHELTDKATAALKPFGKKGDIMREISNSLLVREY
jgi:geranylgeranyl diphosphate synthase type II